MHCFQEKEMEILYLQSELVTVVQEKSSLKARLHELEQKLSMSQAKSLNLEVEKVELTQKMRNLELELEELKNEKRRDAIKNEILFLKSTEATERITVQSQS